ncbi:zinc finger protein SNAI2-like [Culex pipiens pallens]|uniref:zinc finger protein SNAI2-like n=1 Tax=Culex pipiens pallens TaxID=42434 RepID=UPI0019532F17|nr:zinc finger protein SNAI2-like [Culex pipiens pallens]
MEFGVDSMFGSHHQVDEYYANSNLHFILPSFSIESAQNVGLYYEQESPFDVGTVPDYVPDQQTIYYIRSSEVYPTCSPPQQAEIPYCEGPTADTELDQQSYSYADMTSYILSHEVILGQNGAAVVSPLDSGSSATSSSEYNDIPATVSPEKHSASSSLEAANAHEPTVTVVPTPSKQARKRGRKPLPKVPVTESEFYCLPCNQAFKSRRGLLQHNHYNHSGPKEHQCAQCGKKYSSVELLQTHVRKHNDAFKPYGCQQCTKRFSRPYDLKRHIWTSHGESPFGCRFCDKRFGRLDYVEQHEISHKNKTVIVKKKA